MSILPPTRPRWPEDKVESLLIQHGVRLPVALLGVRGYYRDSMGKPLVNDVGIYDDAIFLRSPAAFSAFNANTDPGRLGLNARIGKPYAVLKPGLYLYHLGLHHPGKPGEHLALRQAGPVTVIRDPRNGKPVYEETGEFYIHIHCGVENSTGSDGCQTVHPKQYREFITTVEDQLTRYAQKVIPYLLIESQG